LPGDHGESLSMKLVSETGHDMAGTYVVPFLCRWHDRTWQSVATKRRIEATVIGCAICLPNGIRRVPRSLE